MKRIKRDIALFLTLCMLFTCTIPAYAEDVNVPVMTIETFEAPAEAAEVVVEEAAAAEAAEAAEAELTEGEVSEEVSAESAEKTEQAAMLGEDGVTKETVTYIDKDGTPQEKNCIIITSADGYSFEENEWYAVKGNVTITNRIENNAPNENEKSAHLILTDGCEFNVPKGINNKEWKSLYIYGQTNQTGKLNITDPDRNNAGIGGSLNQSGGFITINGGTITATGGYQGAGIGGGYVGNGGTIIINGGNVTARGGYDASGIGLGREGTGGNVTINGGTINAYGGDRWGKGIGDGTRIIKSGLMIYAGNSRETAKLSDPKGVNDAKFVFISDTWKSANYTVSHQLQKVDASGYDEEKEPMSGGVDWNTEAAARNYAGFTAEAFSQKPIASDGSTEIIIKYNRNINTITFDTNRLAAVPEPIKAVTGADIEAPQDPKAEGYLLEGWYKEKEYINRFTFSTMPTEDLTLYAKWEADPSQRQKVQYVDENGSIKEESCIVLSKDKDFYVFDTGEWYAVTGNVTINCRSENKAAKDSPAHLILKDEASLTIKGGINNPGGKGLVIYGQSAGTGVLATTDLPEFCAGIGGGRAEGGGEITINGGSVNTIGGEYSAGIGGGIIGEGGKITINGGIVTATGGKEGAGIGGGGGGSGGEITINGGTITAINITSGAAIGGGIDGPAGTLVFGKNPGVLRAGSSKDDASDVDVDTYKEKQQDYGFVTINYAKASYTVEHWKQKTVRGKDYQLDADATEILSGFVDTYAEVVSKEYPGYGEPQYTPETIKADGTTKIAVKYDLIYSTITFDANGHGTDTEPIYATPGSAITAPSDPHAEGYIFEGWYTEAECTNKYVFTTMPPEDQTLYAKWTPVRYTITWKDGAKVLRTDKVNYDAMPDYGPDPVKQGYEFLHWWPTVQKVTGDATYNAIFFKPSEKYTVTWMLNDIKLIDTTEVSEGEMPVHANPAIEGYIFIGWQPALAPVTGNVKYTAYFEERGTDKIAVTFNTGGGTFINTQVIDRNTTPVKPADPQKAGCRFEGWYREAGFVTPYGFDEPFNTDMTLYAKWEVLPAVVYTVTWNMDDGTLIDTTRVNQGEMPVHGNPSKDGYIFVGWNPAPAPVTSDITYTARFEKRSPDKAAVMFNTDGGSFVETQVITKGQKAVRPSDPAKSGYEFVNWYADAAFAALYDFSTAVTADITIYAKWKKNAGREYTITWKDWDGKVLATSKVAENGLPKYPGGKPSRSGYNFTGWTPEIDLASADTTYTATYAPQTVINGGGGGGSSAPAVRKATVTFSPNWNVDVYGVWRIKNSAGQVVTNAWLCDDAVDANGQNVWYLLTQDGAMLAAGLVQDNTGNFYSLETNHDGYFGMLRYTDGYYNCNGQQVYLKFSQKHDGTFGAVINADGIEKLKAIYGVTQYGIGNENAVYTKTF